MDILSRVHAQQSQLNAILAEDLSKSSRFLLEECARPHVEAAFANRLLPGSAAETHYATAEPYFWFVEGQEQLRASMYEQAERALAEQDRQIQ